jgi:hypothetical protein
MDLADVAPLTVVECPGCGAPQTVFQRFGPFLLERLLGVGGMGAVYKAMDVALQRPIAVKVLQKTLSHDLALTAQFEREAALTARVNHPGVVRVYSSGTAHGMFYIAMELVACGSLDGLMEKEGAIPEPEMLRIGIQVAEGLLAASRAGLVHRDIKPGNILFAEQNQPKIVDFGLALQSNQTHAPDGEIWGTPFYVSPEALAFQPEDHRSDMYSLGATLWHAFAGAPPHPSTSISIQELLVAKRHPVELGRVCPAAHPQTAAVLDRMLSFTPEERFPDYETLLQEMRSALAAVQDSRSGPPRATEGGGAPKTAYALTLALALAGGGLWWTLHKKTTPPAGAAAEPSLQTDEARLFHAINLLRDGGKIDSAIKRLELVSSSPDLTPDLQLWSAVSLGTAWGLKGDLARQKSVLQSALNASQGADEDLKKFASSLLSAPEAGPPKFGDTAPGRSQIQHLWRALGALARNRPAEAAAELKKAAQPAAGYAEPGRELLPLPGLLLEKLEAVISLEKEIVSETKPEGRSVLTKRAEELSEAAHVSPLLKNQSIALVAKARNAAARALEAKQAPKPPQPPAAEPPKPEKTAQPAPAAQPPQPQIRTAPAAPSAETEALRTKISQHAQFFRFKEAKSEGAAFRPANPEEQSEQQRLLRQLGAVENLFSWCLQEINRGGTLPSPILRNGTPFKSDPVKANDRQIMTQVAPGTPPVPISWAEISPLYLVKLVQFRLNTTPAHPQRAEILWGAGNVYAILGARGNARPFLEEAAKLNASYADALQGLSAPSNP